MTRDPANLQAFNEARAMLDDLRDAGTLADLNALEYNWLGSPPMTGDANTMENVRDRLTQHIRDFCADCGINAGYVGI